MPPKEPDSNPFWWGDVYKMKHDSQNWLGKLAVYDLANGTYYNALH
jgi:hypothetical protein